MQRDNTGVRRRSKIAHLHLTRKKIGLNSPLIRRMLANLRKPPILLEAALEVLPPLDGDAVMEQCSQRSLLCSHLQATT